MTARLQLDHLVIAVSDLEGAIADYLRMGFNVLPGGAHGHAPTRNALVVFADGVYFELIEWTAPAPDDRWYAELTGYGEGLVDYAFVPRDLQQVLSHAGAHNLAYVGPIDGSRITPAGIRLEWQLGRPQSAALPFFCADITARSLRVSEGAARKHDNDALGISSVAVAVADAAAALDAYRSLLESQSSDIRFESPRTIEALGLDVGVVTLEEVEILLVSPAENASTDAANALRRLLAERGTGAYRLVLRTRQGGSTGRRERRDTRGVLLEFAHALPPRADRVDPRAA